MDPIQALESVGAFLVSHSDLISLVYRAIMAGVDKPTLVKLIEESMVAASDAEMKAELG